MAQQVENSERSRKDVERIAAFSDAIFAFSMTVLALEIKVPTITGNPVAELPAAIIEQSPHFLSFVVGFLVVAMYWSGHHRMFRYIRRVDGRLVWLNILLLMGIAFMPVPTDYLGEYANVPLIAAIYAAVLIIIAIVDGAMWSYVASHKLLDEELSPRLIRLYQLRIMIPAIIFALSIPVAFIFGAIPAELSWILIWPALVFVSSRYRDVSPQIYGSL
jgi:uncharacterized membrane protein